MDQIEIKNAGAVEKAPIPLPPAGGVVVLRGHNGSGKSSTIAAIQRACGGKPRDLPGARDGAQRGSVEGLGVRLTIGRNTRISGELECTAIEGRWSVSEIVDPGLKDPAAADAARLRALLSLHGAEGDIGLFASLLPGEELSRLVSERAVREGDLVEQARLVRADLHERARTAETLAERAEARATAERGTVGDVDLSLADVPEAELRSEVERAVSARAALRERAGAAQRTAAEAQEASERLAVIDLPDLSALEASEAEADSALDAATDALDDARRALAEAEQLRRNVLVERDVAQARLAEARKTEQTAAALRRAIDAAGSVAPPTGREMQDADDALSKAQERAERAAVARRAAEAVARSEAAKADARAERERAELLREAARGTDDVLSAALRSPRLRVEGGVIVCDHRRGTVPFAQLSHGERYALLIPEVVERMAALDPERAGVLPVPQPAWEGLDPDNRRLVWEAARAAGAVVITGEAADGPLRAVMWAPRPAVQP